MQAFLLTIHILAVLGLIGAVLLQRSEGGALGIGMSSFMTGRGQANLLTRTTMILAVVFFITSLSLTILAGFGSAQRSLLQGIPQGTGQGTQGSDTNSAGSQPNAPTAPPQNGAGSLLDQLQKLEQQRSGANNSGSAPIRILPPATTSAAPPSSPLPAQPAQTPSSPPAPPAN